MAWQIYELTNSALDIGLLGLTRGAPQMALILLGGVLADAVDRRRLMLATQVGQAMVSLSLVLLTWTAAISPLALYIASAFQALLASLETPSRQALVPNLVPREHLPSGIALYTAQRNIGAIAGPALAGLLLAVTDAGWCYGVDALSWLGMVFALALMRAGAGSKALRATGVKPPATAGGRLAEMSAGIRFVLGQPVLLAVLALDFGANMFGSARALLPIYARDILMVGTPGLGLLYTATSTGAIAGGAGLSFLGRLRRAGLWVLLGQAGFGLSTAAFALSGEFWLSWALLAASGAGDTLAAVVRGTIVQLMTPDQLRGRVSSVNAMFSNGGPQLGQFRAGLCAEWWGAPTSALTGGLITAGIVGLVATAPGMRQYRLDRDVR